MMTTNQTTTTTLDAQVRKLTAFATYADMAKAMNEGYVPTITDAEFALALSLAGHQVYFIGRVPFQPRYVVA